MSRAPLVAGLGGGLAAAALLAVPTAQALSELWSARQHRANLEASLAAPVPPAGRLTAPELAIAAGNRASATRRFAQQVRARAASAGVLVETLAPTGRMSGLITLRVRLSGPEKAVVALTHEIERGTPLTRFRSWEVQALNGGGVRVEGELVAAWR